ncbi:MAG TPA: outer membrane beta-barrel protein [Vicinamibacterales bacterium]|nr:outer membrane beta-barrel protein [Vicinamibacterales bacterium]
MTRAVLAGAVAFLLASVVPCQAQDRISMRGFADAGLTIFTATQSFKAILGSPAGPVFGGGVEVGLTRNVFVSVRASRFRQTGNRVFVFQNQVFTLNESDTITVTPLQLSAGYRFLGRRPARLTRPPRFTPYAGGGVGWYRFSETSAHSTADEDEKTTNAGYHVLAGVEIPIRNWMAAAVDGRWSFVPNAFGDSASSVASLYDEHNLGGFTLSGRIIVGR